ncbi:MAG: PQQ-binding-like beta-propeller repeat protein [bacterium]
MTIILTLFLLQQTYALGTWPKYGATLENTHLQYMKGAMFSEPDVKWSYKTGDIVESYGATVADADKDDTMEVVIGSWDNKIYCFNGTTGIIKWSYLSWGDVRTSSAIFDIDKDDTLEVVIGSDKVYCLNGGTGVVKWSYIIGSMVTSSPTIADIDKDDTMEVAIGSWDHKVYCLNGITGGIKWSYLTRGDISSSAPAIADIDKDSNMEVVIGSEDSTVYCLNGMTGVVKWSYTTESIVTSSPTIADVDKDDTLEAIIEGGKTYCLNGVTGVVKWSYPIGALFSTSPAPAIADVNNDDTMEVVIGGWDDKVYCLNGITGEVRWSYTTGYGVHRGISIADIDMDDKFEVFVPNLGNLSGAFLYCLNGESGLLLWKKQFLQDVHDITIADIDNDGCVELVVSTLPGAIWALDDISNSNNCGCMGTEEKSKELKVESFEFKVIKEKIYLSVPNTIEADIKLYDLCGRMKEVIYLGALGKGNYTFTPNIHKNGIYFVRLTTGNYKLTKKLILMK